MNNISSVIQCGTKAPFIGLMLLIAGSVWTADAGAAWLWQYAAKPGKAGQVAPRWPTTSGISTTTGEPALLVFASKVREMLDKSD